MPDQRLIAGNDRNAQFRLQLMDRRRGANSRARDEQSVSLRLKHLFLEVRRSNVRAIEMYEARGFQVVGIRRSYYTRPVEDA